MVLTNNADDAQLVIVLADSDLGSYRRRSQDSGARLMHKIVKNLKTDIIILDYGMLFLDKFNLERVHSVMETEITKIKELEKPILILGGDHSITYGAAKCFKNADVHSFDAHPDLVIDQTINSQSFMQEFKSRLSLHGVRYSTEQEKKSMNELRTMNSKEVYLTIDVDVLNPNIMPGVAYPVKGGLSLKELENQIGKIVKGKKIVCADITEFCPVLEKKHSTKAIKQILKFLVEILKSNYNN